MKGRRDPGDVGGGRLELLQELLAEDGEEDGAAVRIPRREDPERDAPLSFAQQRLWFLHQLDPGTTAYNFLSVQRLSGDLHLAALQAALTEVVRRHEVLRTAFPTVAGRPVQRVTPASQVPLAVVDLSALPGDEGEERHLCAAVESSGRPYDLAAGPPFRTELHRLGADEHALVINAHHIVFDGWSMGVLFRELGELYGAFRERRPSPLRELPIQYADYSVWQRSRLSGELLSEELEYWQQQLAGAAPVLEVPSDRPRLPVQSFRAGRVPVTLRREVVERLRELSRAQGATLFMTLLSAFEVLLSRYTGQEDLVVGSPIANRNREEIEGLIGFFVNMLALRVGLGDDPSFRELVARVREVCVGAYCHQELPFERLVEALRPERDLSRAPLFQVTFALQNTLPASLELTGLDVRQEEAVRSTARFDLEAHLWEAAGAVSGHVVYNSDLFEAETVARMVGHWERVAEAAAAEPDLPVDELPMLTAEERRLQGLDRPPASAATEVCLHRLFAARAEERPEAIALVCDGERLSYTQLDRWSDRVARCLAELGVGPEQRVGLWLERSAELVVGILGVLKAGGAFVPMDPAFPTHRLEQMAASAGAVAVIGAGGVRPSDLRLPDGVHRLDLAPRDDDDTGGFRPSDVRPDHLAYVLYTSGSAGAPKGVMVEHRSVVALLRGFEKVAPARAPLVGASICPAGFDVSVWELFSPLCFGGTLHVVPAIGHATPEGLGHYLLDHRVTSAYIHPFFLERVADVLEEHRSRVVLDRLLVGVEPIPQGVLQRYRDLPGAPVVVNGYGPTEATVCSTFFVFERATEPDRRTPIGRPVAGYRARIVDEHLRPVPIAVPGELLIGGVGLARGYLGEEELTAEVFMADPWSDEEGARLFRTGDLARFLADGNMEFLGRLDRQIKLHGLRIEPAEVEAVVRRHPGVTDVVVGVREGAAGERRLVAWVAAEGREQPSAGELRRTAGRWLPGYMVPSAWVVLDRLPLTEVGKVDFGALPAPGGGEPASGGYVAPGTPLEKALARAWSEALDVERVGLHDNFFDLGGHSLLAAEVVATVQDRLGVTISPGELIMQNLGQLAASVESSAAVDRGSRPSGWLTRLLRRAARRGR